MRSFALHDHNSAPEAANALPEKSHRAFGRIPGLHAVMAESPELLNAHQAFHGLFLNSRVDADEKTLARQTINPADRGCLYERRRGL